MSNPNITITRVTQGVGQSQNLNGRRKPSGDHLPGWVGCCRIVVRAACVSLDDPAIQRFRRNPQLIMNIMRTRKGSTAFGRYRRQFWVEKRFCRGPARNRGSGGTGLGGLQIECVTDTACQIPRIVGFLQYR